MDELECIDDGDDCEGPVYRIEIAPGYGSRARCDYHWHEFDDEDGTMFEVAL